MPVATSVQAAVNAAVEQRLTNDATLDGVLGVTVQVPHKVFDLEVPAGLVVPPPYIVLGSATANPDDVLHRGGTRGTLLLHYWSAYMGKREIDLIRIEVVRLLHRVPLTLPGGLQWFDGTVRVISTERDPAERQAGPLMHGVDVYEYAVRG